ncbi:MAG: glycosyltransferase family 2 protein [Pseudomonadota bacterium]
MTTWGLSATILAPARDILRFAAYHLEQGAHRLYIYLDDDTPEAFAPLKAHPKIRVQTCDTAYWKRHGGKRPDKHQVRQGTNATHAYHRRVEVNWLIHMDVDEFLVPQGDIGTVLGRLPDTTLSARSRPIELLGGGQTAFKGFIPNGPARLDTVQKIYPTFGLYLKGGFVSHVAGKVFVRTGLPDVSIQIHNAFQAGEQLPRATELVQVDLAHCHATSWGAWLASYRYRLERGSYRAELQPAIKAHKGGMNLHDLFRMIEADAGEAGLRAFYDEVIGDSADLRARLEAQGLLRLVDLDLDGCLARHFPDVSV